MASEDDVLPRTVRKYFSTLYFRNEENRTELPTSEDELEKTDYEGRRYQIPEEMEDVFNSGETFTKINEIFENKVSQKDIRFLREYLLKNGESDYKYRFWLQHEVESMSSGNRSIRILTERNEEEEEAMWKLNELTLKLAKQIFDYTKSTLAKNYKKTNYLKYNFT